MPALVPVPGRNWHPLSVVLIVVPASSPDRDPQTSPEDVTTLPDQGRRAEARGEFHVAREYYERALRELDADAPIPAVGSLLLQIARTHVGTGNTTAAGDCVEAILALPDHGGLDVVLAEALELRGRLACAAGQLDSAESDFHLAREYAEAARYADLVAAADENLAAVCLVRGDWTGGVAHLERATDGFAATGDDGSALRAGLQLAGLLVDVKRWNAAEQAFAAALARANALADERSQALIDLARAEMALDRSNVERARSFGERALDRARNIGDSELIARCLLTAAVLARESDDSATATRLFADAERHIELLDDTMLAAELHCERADLLARDGQHDLTLRTLNAAWRNMARVQAMPGTAGSARRLRRLEAAFLEVTRRWGQRIESQDHDTGAHVERVADLTVAIARRMGVAEAELFWYRVGASLHDIGKLSIPAAVLNKEGRLTPDEWTLVKRHPVVGAAMLRDADFPWEVRPIVESHHECWDGTGYPHGLAGEEIPLAARIFCVADVYDALISRRPFKHDLGSDEAIDAMRRDVGRQFDPAVFRVFEDIVREGVAIPGVTSAGVADRPNKPASTSQPIVDDPLTAVADSASWARRATTILADGRRASSHASLLLVDIDHFSRVNATCGRLQGDDLLWAVAKTLQRGLRGGDLLGRRGGDEFAILLPATTSSIASEIAHRLREAVASLRCARRDAPEEFIAVTVSVAVASSPGDGETVESLLASTDRALHRARRDGRDCVVVADHVESAHARASLDFDGFIAREDELRTLIGQLDLAARGEGRFVGISGEAGIGKSALVRQLESEVALRDGTFLIATPGSNFGEQAPPLGHWTAVLEGLAASGFPDPRAGGILAQLKPDPDQPDDRSWLPPLPFVQQEVVAAIRRSARNQLRVIVLEDLHAAGGETWSILDALLSSVDDEKLLVCYTIRPDESHPAAEWRRRLAHHPRSSVLHLRRFTQDEIRRWIRSAFRDAAPGHDADRFLFQHSEGVPRDVVNILRACVEGGTIWYGGTRWEWKPPDPRSLPAGVTQVLKRRLQRLPASARELLATAAVLGEELNLELLVSATGIAEQDVREALEAGITASVLRRDDASREERYVFTHPVLVDACAASVPERQRQRIHEVAARVLELRAPSRSSEIAAHYHAAGNDEAAYANALRAAQRSLSIRAHDAAIEALQLAQRYAPSARELAELRVRYAETALMAGRYAWAESRCDLALEWLDRHGTPGLTHRARRLRHWLALRRGLPASQALDALTNLAAGADSPGLASERAATCFAVAECALMRADWSVADLHARRGLESVNGETSPSATGQGLIILGIAEHAGAADVGLARLREARALLSSAGDDWLASRAALAIGESLLRTGPAVAADEALADALEEARATHNASVAASASRSLGELRGREGRFEEALQWLGDADRLFGTMSDEPDRARTALSTAVVLMQRGDRSHAHSLFDSAARRGRDLDLTWIELAAMAGASLTNGGPGAESSRARWSRISELIAESRADWWFPGRELVDALAIRTALGGGHAGVAWELFQRGGRRLEGVDAFGLLWLVNETGAPLEAAGFRNSELTRDSVSRLSRHLGFGATAGHTVGD
ncbi:MAG: HD domain-containing phosphohydrolase [Gemmatimonadota bacterium]